MVEINTSSNLFNLSDNAISALKKVELVQISSNLIFETFVIRFQIYLKYKIITKLENFFAPWNLAQKHSLIFRAVKHPFLISMRRKSRHVCAALPFMPFISATKLNRTSVVLIKIVFTITIYNKLGITSSWFSLTDVAGFFYKIESFN